MLGEVSGTYPDIYFVPDYARLYETEDCKAVEYKFECSYGVITNLFLKRKTNIFLQDGICYYDIVTPYGYGGPVIHFTTDKFKLIQSYMKDFRQYTEREKIIAEFVRFHPIIGNGIDFQDAYQSICDRKTVGTNLTFNDVPGTEFSKHKRRIIRKLLKNPDIRYEVEECPDSLDEFIEIYYSTMDRDEADEYYYFQPDYFHNMQEKLKEHIITGKVFLGDKLIAMGIYFRYGKYLHAHLSGTLTEYLDYSPAYILKYALALYGHENGYQVIHYGGGSSTSEENGLYKFKKDFGLNTKFDFYIARKVWNDEVYLQSCKAVGADINTGFFPAYRGKER